MRTIPALLDSAARRLGERIWLCTDDAQLSFSAAAERVAVVARRLRELGTGHGDVVVVTARNEPSYLITLLAVTAVGAIAVPTNPRGSHSELRGLLAQLGAGGRVRAVVTDAAAAAAVRPAASDVAPAAPVVDVAEISSAEEPGRQALDPTAVAEDDVAFMIPTSGTTGRSKLVMQTHRTHVLTGEGFPYWMELTDGDRFMTSLPLFHTNALAYSVMGSLASWARLVLLPRFSASGFLDAARRHEATTFNAIGAMLELLMDQPARIDDADGPLRTCYTAPSPPERFHRAAERRFGLRLVCGYGLSESPYGMVWRPGTRPYGTLGWPRQHPTLGEINRARVVDDAGRDVATGMTGELLLNNPAVTPGYYGMPEETASLLAGGWLHTGDLVTRNPDGSYTFVARKKDVIRRRGENLSPAEVEQALTEHPAVAECAVVGVPAGLSEEEVKAYVRWVPRAEASLSELRDWAAERLTAFKVPRFWQVVGEMPRTPTGRVAKHALPTVDGEELDLAPPRTSRIRS